MRRSFPAKNLGNQPLANLSLEISTDFIIIPYGHIMVASERDSLIERPSSGTSPRDCQVVSNWALTCSVLLLVITTLFTHESLFTSGPSGSSESTPNSISDPVPPISYGPHTSGRYYATQFISFTINTLGGSASDGECEGRPIDPKEDACYLGNNDIETDVNHRLAIIEDVLSTLRNDVFTEEPEIDRDPRVLKILMLPEFFLRGPSGAYPTDEMFQTDTEKGELIKMSDRIRDMIADPAFEDYLFVFGTVIASESIGGGGGEHTARDHLYFNFAPVYRGGPEDDDPGHSHHYIIMKKYISGADFLSRTELPNPGMLMNCFLSLLSETMMNEI